MVRLYEQRGESSSAPMATDGLVRGVLRTLKGDEIEELGGFKIGSLVLTPVGSASGKVRPAPSSAEVTPLEGTSRRGRTLD